MNKPKYNIKTQADAIKHFIMQMDIEMIEAFLSENHTYQNMPKEVFLLKLGKVFDKFKNSGDTQLYAYHGKCNTCFKDKEGFTFVGNSSFNYISIIVDIKNGLIKDMFECSNFINNEQFLLLNKKFYIDDLIDEILFGIIK